MAHTKTVFSVVMKPTKLFLSHMAIQIRILFTLTIGLLTFSATSYGQKGEEVGGYLGTAVYYGDLNTSLSIQKPGVAGGIYAKKNFNNRLSLRGGLNFARVGASDSNSTNNFERGRNLSFNSNIYDFTGGLEFNFLEHNHGSKDKWYTPYVFAGFSVFYFNPTAKLGDTRYSLRKLGTEGQGIGDEYSAVSTALTIATGFKWDISQDLSLNVELTARRLFTDYIDDVSTVFPDFTALEANRGEIAVQLSNRATIDGIGVEGRQRGNSRTNDTYLVLGIGITKYFGHIYCPKISDW